MSDLTNILKRVRSGESAFSAADGTPDALREFQVIGKALAHANREGFLERCVLGKESLRGDLYYNKAFVIGGLSYKGEQYLRQETTVKGWLGKYSPSALQWLFGIVAGLVLAALVRWLVP